MTPEFWVAVATLALEMIKVGREVWVGSSDEEPESHEEDKKG